jgi:hypothetical protein
VADSYDRVDEPSAYMIGEIFFGLLSGYRL